MNIILHRSAVRLLTVQVLALLCCFISTISKGYAAVGDKFTQGNLTYTVISESGSTGTVSVYRASGSTIKGNLIIPSEITNSSVIYKVTSIGSTAFKGCRSLTGLSLSSSLTSIGDYAFYGCSGLTGELKIPESVTSIGSTAFKGCRSLTGLSLSSSLTSIGDYTFNGCSGLTGELKIPESVTSIGSNAFSDCSGLTGLSLSSSLTSISSEAFSDCSGLTGELKIPESVTSIGSDAFSDCSGLTGLSLSSSLTSIGDYAFYGCSGLTGELKIPESVTSIGSNAFKGCRSLTGLSLSSSLTSIGDYTFNGCSGLTGELKIPESVTSIGEGAFYCCSGLTGELKIPESVTSIGSNAFGYCSGLTGELKIPESVTSIGYFAFQGCSGLTGLSLSSSLTSIGGCAFKDCSIKHLTLPRSLSSIAYNIISKFDGDYASDGQAIDELTIPDFKDVSNISEQSSNTIFYLSDKLPAYSNFGSSSCKNLYLKSSLYEICKSSADWDKWYSKFHVTDSIPVTIPSDRSYITLCRDFDVDLRHTNDNLPSGVAPLKAYIVSGIDTDNNAIILQEITYVPSRLRSNEDGFKGYDEYVGVLLKGTPGYTYYYTIGEEDYTKGKDGQMTLEKALALSNGSVPTTTATFVGANDPKYVTPEVTIDGVTYTTYGLKDNKFCRYSKDGYVPYNHAYLRIATSNTGSAKPMLNMIFKNADGTTSIEQIKDDSTFGKSTKDTMYNLQGMKVDDNYHGIVIVNGHKFFKK